VSKREEAMPLNDSTKYKQHFEKATITTLHLRPSRSLFGIPIFLKIIPPDLDPFLDLHQSLNHPHLLSPNPDSLLNSVSKTESFCLLLVLSI
jgi:hypothetical protein